MPNRLAASTSPYLLQHQHNPVDWYPWGEEALAKAKADDKPIFLSIGYSACHWCHVMAHESFEDLATATVMNDLFVNIKVDREERPDLDSIYMGAVVALTGNGGWPMSVFLTPAGVPFFGGTYFPPEARGGMPSFRQVLVSVHEAWAKRRDAVEAGARDLLEHLRPAPAAGADLPGRPELGEAVQGLWRTFDWRRHGWGQAPKFPQPMAIEFCLRYHALTGEATPLEMAIKSLRAMARGGIYDQLAGGFHRYSTDAHWLVPHFEKMLYDNAQLARVYLHAWQITREADFRRVAEEILDYIQREMTDPAGGFYSTTDADSEGEEGKYFVWSAAELDEALGEYAPLFKAYYGVTAGGNFEGQSILFLAQDREATAAQFKLTPEVVRARLTAARQTLLKRRAGRVPPGLDDKVLAGWNGLMLAAFAEGARVLDRADYAHTAAANAAFLLTQMRAPDGRLRRSWRRGQSGAGAGYLEDYANVAEGLLTLYETTFDESYFTAARELLETVLTHFADPAGGFFDTADDHEVLVVRPKDTQDNATPSGGAMAATALLKLAAFTGEARYQAAAENALAGVGPFLARYPSGFAQWLNALTFRLGQPREIALVGDPAAADTRALLEVVHGTYRPFQVTALGRPGAAAPLPLLAERQVVDGKATAYVCRNFVCQLPVTEPADLRAQLETPAG